MNIFGKLEEALNENGGDKMTNYDMLLDRLQDIKNPAIHKIVKAAVEIARLYNSDIEPASQAGKLTEQDKAMLDDALDLPAKVHADIEQRKETGIW